MSEFEVLAKQPAIEKKQLKKKNLKLVLCKIPKNFDPELLKKRRLVLDETRRDVIKYESEYYSVDVHRDNPISNQVLCLFPEGDAYKPVKCVDYFIDLYRHIEVPSKNPEHILITSPVQPKKLARRKKRSREE
jgi:hypothetical protein